MCPTYTLKLNPPGKLVEHVAMHILHDPIVRNRDSPCGFCGGSGDSCAVFLRKGKGRDGMVAIDVVKSRCKNGNVVKLSIAASQESVANSPSTNHPIPCPLCPTSTPAIWKYNLKDHIEIAHPTADVELYQDSYALETVEIAALLKHWNTKQRWTKARLRDLGNINISDVHSAQLNSA